VSPEEQACVVDSHGTVLGSELRSVVRRDNLLHAATAVLVRNSAGDIYVHRRSNIKDWAPGHHDAAAGGVTQFGEQPDASARRELAEELGIDNAPLIPLGTSLFEDETVRCLGYIFEVVWDGPIVHQESEVVWGSWMTLAELGSHLADPTWQFVPDTRALLVQLAADDVHDYPRLRGYLRR
jgi:isopentenyldiphosphate isomerase